MPTSERSSRHAGRLGLVSLFPEHALFEDTNGDGTPDRLNLRLWVDKGLSDAPLWAGILNIVARLAGETVALDLPVAAPLAAVSDTQPCLIVRQPSPDSAVQAELRRLGAGRVALCGSSAARMAEVLTALALAPAGSPIGTSNWAALRAATGNRPSVTVIDRQGRERGRLRLSALADPAPAPAPEAPARFAGLDLIDLDDGFTHSPEDTPRARHLRLGVSLERAHLAAPVGFALADFIALAVLGATALNLPLVLVGRARQSDVLLRVRETAEGPAGIRLASRSGREIRAEGPAAQLAACIRAWGEIGFGGRDDPGDGSHRRVRAEVAAARDILTGRDRRGVWAKRLASAAVSRAKLPPASKGEASGLRRACRTLGLKPPAVWSDPGLRFAERWPSELHRAAELVRRVPAGTGRLEGLVLVSKPQKARRRLKTELEGILRVKGYRPRIAVLNAYKPGLCWLLEVVRPRLRRVRDLYRLELAYRPFAPGVGALEMESRFLQEIYPGPDLLARYLGWPEGRIRLRRHPGLAQVYRLRGWDRNRRLVLERGFTPRWTRLSYLPGRPESGTVHPACGGVLLTQEGRTLVDEDLPTDREVFWRIFQERWMPALESAMAARIEGPGQAPQAFWEEVRFEVAIDETDRRLGLGEERVSPMEALHEDLYFVLLDFCRLFAQERGLPPGVQFGRILPVVRAAARGGRPSARMSARLLPPAPQVEGDGPGTEMPVRAFSRQRGVFVLGLAAPSGLREGGRGERLCRVARALGCDLRPEASGDGIALRVGLRRPPRPSPPPPRPPASPPPTRRRLGLAEAGDWVARLGRLPHLREWQAGTTWEGRPVHVLEAVLEGGGQRASLARLRLLKPTLLMNARHHANEVSSTHAALTLAWELAVTDWGRQALRRVNVALVPLENADGVATLEKLLPGAAGHKLHAARYNALGVEWYADYFSTRPRFPEARVKPRLWRRWLPRIVMDAHGVPSHEWEQPFSGYAPGRFREHWIPRAFIYAIVPYLDQPGHPGHQPARRLVRVMAQAVADDLDISALNRELTGRYRRYALRHEPGTFPAVQGKSLAAVPPEERVAGLNFGVQRFPVTVSEIITEVTDEVVSGRLLELCARGHLKVARGLIEHLGRRPPGRLVRRRIAGGGLALEWKAGGRRLLSSA